MLSWEREHMATRAPSAAKPMAHDELLGRNGRLTAAVTKIYARRMAARPDLADAMRRLERAREVELGLGTQPLK
jgi:hypothetical protein